MGSVIAVAVVTFVASAGMNDSDSSATVRLLSGAVALVGVVVLVTICFQWVKARNDEEMRKPR
jgi:hypothetical protein